MQDYITKNDIFNACLIASIGHAISTNIYPMLSHEQSWDGLNFSMQNSFGTRCTITFESNYCVGGIRNDKSSAFVYGDSIQKYISDFPPKVICKAYEEAFQYLLLENNGIAVPCVTGAFWADSENLHYKDILNNSTDTDFLGNIFTTRDVAFERWIDYFNLDEKSVELLDMLYRIKTKDFFEKVYLNDEQIKLIPGGFINAECIESLGELNIVV